MVFEALFFVCGPNKPCSRIVVLKKYEYER